VNILPLLLAVGGLGYDLPGDGLRLPEPKREPTDGEKRAVAARVSAAEAKRERRKARNLRLRGEA
jgi:hypothetical protein